ncbi:MAG: Gfo/Idh/MocA family oxidoreductase [Acidimicrobiia bacterium]|nr:Gfo/Idh/MocA family oxidoreductase [Acidimicrobiia bacterium]
MADPIRIGILGAARIAPTALIKPARRIAGVEVVAIAARDRSRAENFAQKHSIATVHDSYEALLADGDIDAVYNPLPNGLHGRWNLAAIQAGKHVLSEKPFAANAEEAKLVALAATNSSVVVMEAFHYRYHPYIERVLEIISSGELGTIRRIETKMCIPLPMRNDIRYDINLAGGALMDVGCYAIHQARTLAGSEPEVLSAKAKCARPEIDRWAKAELRWADGLSGSIECALWSGKLLSLTAKVTGEHGELKAINLTTPQMFHRLSVRAQNPKNGNTSKRKEKVSGETTYWYQLQAFATAVSQGGPVLTPPSDSVANMEVIDAVYKAAGLSCRWPTPK